MNPLPEQQDIIEHIGNRVVTANPGSGKTFTLSMIIKKELPELLSYQGIIAISFTNKASSELKNRSLSRGVNKKKSFFGTIDKFFIGEIIMPFIKFVWSVAQTMEVVSIFDIEEERYQGEEIEGLLVDFKQLIESRNEPDDRFLPLFESFAADGVVFLESLGMLGNYVFDNSRTCREYLKARYKYIIVDEYQDSGIFQHSIYTKIVELGVIGIAVGDVNQSIYGFAGKDPRFLIELTSRDDFEVFPLTRNMRCHPSIVNYSLSLISSSPRLLESDSHRVFYKQVQGFGEDVIYWIDNEVVRHMEQFSVRQRNQVAILVKSNAAGEQVLSNIETPAKFLKSTILDTDSSIWANIFKEVLYYVFMEDKTKIEILEMYSTQEVPQRGRSEYSELMDNLRNEKDTPSHLADYMHLFLRIALLLAPTDRNERAIDILGRVLSSEEDLLSYIPPDENEVQILTLHKSKGLEFKITYNIGLYNWILPSFPAMNGNRNQLIQDLNLHYVGITRSEKACFLLSSTMRRISSGAERRAETSRFLNGLDHLRINLR